MAGQELRLYYDAAKRRTFAPFPDIPADRLELTRQEYAVLHVQVVNDNRFAPHSTSGTAPAAVVKDISDQTGTPIVALKTPDQYASTTGDFTCAFSQYVSDSWHSLANGRFSVALQVPASVTAGDYYADIQLANGDGSKTMIRSNHYYPLVFGVGGEVILGSEATAVTGATTNYYGTATIAPGSTTTGVAITGMTEDANVQVTMLGTSTNFSSFVYTATSGSFTIQRSGNSGTADYVYSVRAL